MASRLTCDGRPPDTLSADDVQGYLVRLIEERQLAWSSCSVAVYSYPRQGLLVSARIVVRNRPLSIHGARGEPQLSPGQDSRHITDPARFSGFRAAPLWAVPSRTVPFPAV